MFQLLLSELRDKFVPTAKCTDVMQHLAGRMGCSMDIANMVLFLSSEKRDLLQKKGFALRVV